MRRLIHALLLLSLSFTAAADNGTELDKLHSALNMLNQQQQAVYQHFQMVQEVRRASVPALYGLPIPSTPNGRITNYDTMVAAERNAVERDESLARQADALLTKYNEIEMLKAPLQARIYELTLNPGSEGMPVAQ